MQEQATITAFLQCTKPFAGNASHIHYLLADEQPKFIGVGK